MRTDWLVVLLVGVGTAALKAAGPVLLGGRPLPPRLQSVVAMLAPALLAALVATAALTSGQRLVLDARAVGVAVAAVAIWRGAPVLLVVILAAAAAALVRFAGFG